MTTSWEVVSTERLMLHRENRIANMYVLSPYVWATFDTDMTTVTARCDDPLIAPDSDMPTDTGDMVFAASAVRDGDDVLLYFSQADQDLRVARIRRVGSA